MRVWIDQTRCQGSGLCEDDAPGLFTVGDDFVAYVRQDETVLYHPGGEASQAEVPEELEEVAEGCAELCPSQCIHLVR